MNQTKLWALGGMMLLSSLFAVNADAVNIPITSIATNATKSGTGSCVQGYFSASWTTTASYFQYTLNTTGYSGTIAMDFNCQRSSTGPANMQIWYNYNGVWNLLPVANGGVFTVGTSCATKTATLPAVCSGVPNLLVKFQPMAPLPTNTAGTFRADSINVFDAASASCTTTPNGGSVAGATICAGTSTMLSLTGSSAGAGISYQWQSSPNGSTWTNISGATGLSYTTPNLSSTTHYRVVVTCAGVGSSNSTAGIVTVNTVSVAAITGYSAPLLVGAAQNLASTTPGGVWTSSNEDAATVDLISGVVTGEFGGTSVISYSVTDGVTGCTGAATVNVDVVWPNTLALYAGQNGTSVDVINVPGDAVSNLYAIGFGAATPCGDGGLSGLTVNVNDSVFSTSGPHVGYKVYPTSGNALNMFRIHARARVSNTGPTKARIAYRYWSGGLAFPWVSEAADEALTSGSCGASANSWDFNTGIAANPNPTVNGILDSLEVAVFPFDPGASTGTFQLNTLEVYGLVTTDDNCSGASIVTNADSVFPVVANICDSGSRFLNYNVGNGGISGVNILYQWQNSTDGVNWNDIPFAEGVVYQTPNYIAGVSPDTIYHRVKITCDATGDEAFSAVNVVTVHATPANAGTISASPSIPTKRMLIGTPYTMSSSVAGGTWSSNDTSTISFGGTNVATPNLPGDAVITYRASVNGCTATSRDTFVALHPGTKALYIGKNGNSTAVVAATGATATSLATANWGSAATCGSGGISGLTNTTAAQSAATNGIISTTVGTSGAGFTVTSVRATLRKQPSGAYKAYLGYKPTASATWTIDPSPVDVESDDCGYSHNELSFAVVGGNISAGNSYDFAVFGYNGTAATTFQLNSLSVIGTGSQLINGVINMPSDIQLFPNPATNVLNVKAPGKVAVAIYSIEGKKLIEQQNATRIDVSSLVNGMYLIQVYGENNSLLKTEKFIKK